MYYYDLNVYLTIFCTIMSLDEDEILLGRGAHPLLPLIAAKAAAATTAFVVLMLKTMSWEIMFLEIFPKISLK